MIRPPTEPPLIFNKNKNLTDIPPSTLSEWTAGREPKLSEPVVKLARFFGVSLEYLVTGKEPEQEIVADCARRTVAFAK